MDQLKDDSVIIVGNGGSLLNSRNGGFVDSHDIVVRFNLFKTGKFSDDVGQKTTIWFTNRGVTHPALLTILKECSFEAIYVHTWTNTNAAKTSYEIALSGLGKVTELIEIPKSYIKEMRLYLGQNYSFFSTGAIGVWSMLKHYKKVSLIGFDWWAPTAQFHYCDNMTYTHTPSEGHQPELEKRMFEKLANEGRLALL